MNKTITVGQAIALLKQHDVRAPLYTVWRWHEGTSGLASRVVDVMAEDAAMRVILVCERVRV